MTAIVIDHKIHNIEKLKRQKGKKFSKKKVKSYIRCLFFFFFLFIQIEWLNFSPQPCIIISALLYILPTRIAQPNICHFFTGIIKIGK